MQVWISFLMVGHTHIDIDQNPFSVWSTALNFCKIFAFSWVSMVNLLQNAFKDSRHLKVRPSFLAEPQRYSATSQRLPHGRSHTRIPTRIRPLHPTRNLLYLIALGNGFNISRPVWTQSWQGSLAQRNLVRRFTASC